MIRNTTSPHVLEELEQLIILKMAAFASAWH